MSSGFLFDLGFFALLFFLLVFVHELGHFLMARLVGIRVEKFSIGMGPSLFSKKWGDTEYRIALLPLGGYVKMSGDELGKDYTEEEKARGFLSKSPPQKLLVVFGGPVFNLIFPLFIFGWLLMVGNPSVRSQIGTVDPDSAAAEAGLKSGDLILSIDGRSIQEWGEMEESIRQSADQDLRIEVERLNLQTGEIERFFTNVTPREGDGLSRFGEPVRVGQLGISPRYLVPRIFFDDLEGPMARAGAKPFDRVLELDSIPVQTLDQLREMLALREEAAAIRFKVESYRTGEQREFSLNLMSENLRVSELGLVPAELVVGYVADKVNAPELEPKLGVCRDNSSPARLAGIQEGDRLLSLGDVELTDWDDLQEVIRSSGGDDLSVSWMRDGVLMSGTVSPLRTTIFDPIRGRDAASSVEEVYRIGVGPQIGQEAAFFKLQSYNPIEIAKFGVTETVSLVSLTGEALWKLVTGQLSMKNLGSPIMIFNVAGNSYRLAGGGGDGWLAFLRTLALLSITLGIVNLLPIPVLDGGHAVFFTLEWIRGRPLSMKFLEIATQVGLVALIGIFVVVIYNDVYRYDLVGGVVNNFIRLTNSVFYGCS